MFIQTDSQLTLEVTRTSPFEWARIITPRGQLHLTQLQLSDLAAALDMLRARSVIVGVTQRGE